MERKIDIIPRQGSVFFGGNLGNGWDTLAPHHTQPTNVFGG